MTSPFIIVRYKITMLDKKDIEFHRAITIIAVIIRQRSADPCEDLRLLDDSKPRREELMEELCNSASTSCDRAGGVFILECATVVDSCFHFLHQYIVFRSSFNCQQWQIRFNVVDWA